MKIAVTGISSYLARTLFPVLEADSSIEQIIGLDIKDPSFTSDKLKFTRCDVRDQDLAKHMEGCDTVIHLAYIVMPIKDEALADDINVNGSKNVFRAAAQAGLKKIVHLSSVASYGAWPDNPKLITEEVKPRGMPNFYYSRSKALVEEFLDEFEAEHKDMVITRLRPCIFIGPKIDNALQNIVDTKVMASFRGLENRLQFVWDEDVVSAIHLALGGDFHGAFNLAGDGSMSMVEMAEVMGVRVINVPYFLAYWLSKISWALGLGPLSAGWVEVTRYSIDVDSTKAKEVLGWKPQYDTRGAFKRLLEVLPSSK